MGGIYTDIFNAQVDAQKDWVEERKEEERKVQLNNCYTHTWRVNPLTGGIDSYHFRCKHWRTCPNCYHVKQGELINRVHNAFHEHDTLYLYQGTEEFVTAVVRQIISDNYIRFPIADGCIILATEDIGVECFAIGNSDGLDYNLLTNTPIGKRITGYLGKTEKEEETEKEIIPDEYKQTVYVDEYVAPSVPLLELYELQINTLDILTRMIMDEQKEVSLQQRIDFVQEQFMAYCKENGYPIIKLYTKKHVIDSREDNWLLLRKTTSIVIYKRLEDYSNKQRCNQFIQYLLSKTLENVTVIVT